MMNYEERTRIIGGWLQEELKRYDLPANHTTDRARQEMESMVEDINSEIVNVSNQSNLDHVLSKMAQDVRKNNRSRAWPTIYNFCKAAKKCSEQTTPAITGTSEPFVIDEDELAAKRMNAGEGVAVTYVTGLGADRLLEKNLVTMNVIDMYREGVEQQAAEAQAALQPAETDPIFENPY
ncbi:MAG: hypothetical protein CMJ25_15305 [Phycisphaerae bacterium]|nr:hypothetical protein [Phycisphaerae bacterium]